MVTKELSDLKNHTQPVRPSVKGSFISSVLFVGLASLIFAWGFEWSRYYSFCDPMSHLISTSNKAMLFGFIVCKTVIWMLPFIVISLCLIQLKLFRISQHFFVAMWLLSFLFFAIDLSVFSIQGIHSWDYVEILFSGEPINTLQVFSRSKLRTLVIVITITSVAVCYIGVLKLFVSFQRIVNELMGCLQQSIFRRYLTAASIGFILLCGNAFFLPGQLQDRAFEVLPFASSQKHFLKFAYQDLPRLLHQSKQHFSVDTVPNSQTLDAYQEQRLVAQLVRDTLIEAPKRDNTFPVLNKPNFPNVILIILESFRSGEPGLLNMNRLREWGGKGLNLNRHYSGSNTTRPGLFSLLSGHVPLRQSRDQKVSFQMIDILKSFGYETTFIRYRDAHNYMQINDWYSLQGWDNVIEVGNYGVQNIYGWWKSDQKEMHHARRILASPHDRPQFVMIFLLSSHFPYDFPPEFELCKSSLSWSIWKLAKPEFKIKELACRYSNSLSFLENEILEFVCKLDPDQNIVIVTGDHGESFKEDATVIHGTQSSDAQLRVPFIMVGPGVSQLDILTATSHSDILPTLLHVIAGKTVPGLNCSGRDLIEDPNPADQVVVAPHFDYESQVILLIRGNERFLFQVPENGSNNIDTKFIGMVDEAGILKY